VSRVDRVIVGASGTPGSLPALRHALDLARRNEALLIAVHAWIPPGGDLAERRSPSLALRRVWQEAARERLKDALTVAWGGESPPGLTVRPVVERGAPGPVLLRAVVSADDLLVVGAGRRGLLGRWIGGQVGRYCLAHAPCPVMAVPPPVRGRAGHTLRHRRITLDDALREWGHSPA
jgi:nucleotide-binding universal stress UspA family protein